MTNLLNTIRRDGSPKEKPSANAMNLRQHLTELRHRLMICLVAVAVTTAAAVILYEPILHFLIPHQLPGTSTPPVPDPLDP